MSLLSSLNQIAGKESTSMSQQFMPEFFKLVLGTLSLPINLPGTNYHSGFQVNRAQFILLDAQSSLVIFNKMNSSYSLGYVKFTRLNESEHSFLIFKNFF